MSRLTIISSIRYMVKSETTPWFMEYYYTRIAAKFFPNLSAAGLHLAGRIHPSPEVSPTYPRPTLALFNGMDCRGL